MKVLLIVVIAVYVFCVALFLWSLEHDSVMLDDNDQIIKNE